MTTWQRDCEGTLRPIVRIGVERKLADAVLEILDTQSLSVLIEILLQKYLRDVRRVRDHSGNLISPYEEET